ncbi:MAG: MFS transporter [Phycisphaerae bacterium]|nr:MFS transporter [Phycisphaerae bacterium]
MPDAEHGAGDGRAEHDERGPSDERHAHSGTSKAVAIAVVVAALGYFVDIFDLLLFAIVRIPSLTSLGVPQEEARNAGIWLDNVVQTTGLMVGGLFWGVLGDRRGRLSVLFGSILCYSLANILNAFVYDIDPNGSLSFLHSIGLGTALRQYEVLRFVAGFGLAGELGAGVTLVAELMGKEHRGIGTTIIASVGVLGAVAAALVATAVEWRTAYLIGGLLGVGLLFLRIGVVESGMFKDVAERDERSRGAFWKLAWPPERLRRYLAVIALGLPIWYAVGVLVKYAPELFASLGIPKADTLTPATAIMWCYIGLALGDLASGAISQVIRSRKRAVLLFHALTIVAVALYFFVAPRSAFTSKVIILFLGFAIGYWAVFVTMAAEQFGTNLRATAATTAPNFVRWAGAMGSALLWTALEPVVGGQWQSAAIVGAIVLSIAIVACLSLRETFGVSLDYVER